MRQLIARIEEDLHRRLKTRATAEGRSMNAVVNELLRKGLEGTDECAAVQHRLRSQNLRVVPPLKRRPPSPTSALDATKGTGTAVSEALEAERAAR